MKPISSAQKEKNLSIPTLIGLIVLSAVGVVVWIYQLNKGMQITGLGQQIVWGNYIAGFFTAAGAGAALLFIASVNVIRPILPVKVQLKLSVLSLACFVVAGFMITLDVGYPVNLWWMIVAGRWTSMMTWDFWLLSITVMMSVAHVIFIKVPTIRSLVAVLSLLSAILLVVVEGWMLSTMEARPFWAGGHLIASFLIGAAISGLGVAVCVLDVEKTESLRWWLKFFLGVNLILMFAELTNAFLESTPHALLFWTHVIAGLVIPLLLLFYQSKFGVRVAVILAVLGVFVEKVRILSAGQAHPWLGLPQGSYYPSVTETFALIGAVAIGALVYLGIQQIYANRIELDA